MLSDSDVAELRAIRHALHARPELSGAEIETARRITDHLHDLRADDLVTGLGGHGVAGIYRGAAPGPRLLFRCELDALPIRETDRPHRSRIPGTAHLCGHDGHMTILLGLARLLQRQRPARGEVVLVFQPAEETGAGGPALVADPRFAALRPDAAFALHNMPGLPLGYVGLATGPVASASRGMRIDLTGHESHSADPESAASPRAALAQLMTGLPALGTTDGVAYTKLTVTHVTLGQPNFGITPGQGTLFATLRTRTNDAMADLVAAAEGLAATAAAADGLALTISYLEIFEHLDNAPGPVAQLERALRACEMPFGTAGSTMIPSEDFAAFCHHAPSAMLYLGAGEDHPALHRPDYDFPDALIPIGARLFLQVVRDTLG